MEVLWDLLVTDIWKQQMLLGEMREKTEEAYPESSGITKPLWWSQGLTPLFVI